jgi:hypothetical protein
MYKNIIGLYIYLYVDSYMKVCESLCIFMNIFKYMYIFIDVLYKLIQVPNSACRLRLRVNSNKCLCMYVHLWYLLISIHVLILTWIFISIYGYQYMCLYVYVCILIGSEFRVPFEAESQFDDTKEDKEDGELQACLYTYIYMFIYIYWY